MSTRAVIYLHKTGDKKPYNPPLMKFYQHCDGYLAGLGASLVRACMEYTNSCELKKLIDKADLYHQSAFELMDWISGDCEYVYHIYTNEDDNGIELTAQHLDFIGEERLLGTREMTLYQKARDLETGKYLTATNCDLSESYKHCIYEYYAHNNLIKLAQIYDLDPVYLKKYLEEFRDEYEIQIEKTNKEFGSFLLSIHNNLERKKGENSNEK